MQVFGTCYSVSNGEHKFIMCLNLKYPELTVMDNKRTQNIDETFKKVIVTNTDEMRVATILVRKCFKLVYQYVDK